VRSRRSGNVRYASKTDRIDALTACTATPIGWHRLPKEQSFRDATLSVGLADVLADDGTPSATPQNPLEKLAAAPKERLRLSGVRLVCRYGLIATEREQPRPKTARRKQETRP
jgi:hypothetical protein